MSTSDSDTDFELINEHAEKAAASQESLTTEEKVQLLEKRIVQLEKENVASRDAEKSVSTRVTSTVGSGEKILAQYIEIQELKAKLRVMEAESSEPSIYRVITGSWKPVSTEKLKEELSSKKQQKLFAVLLDSESFDYTARFRCQNGVLVHWCKKQEAKYVAQTVTKQKSIVTTYFFTSEQKAEIERSMEGEKLKMVLKINDEEMVILWERYNKDTFFDAAGDVKKTDFKIEMPNAPKLKKDVKTGPSCYPDNKRAFFTLLIIAIFLLLLIFVVLCAKL